MYQYLKKITFTGTGGETASNRRHARPEKMRKTRRCGGGAFSLLLPLIFAAAMLLHTPVVKAVDVFNVKQADTAFCQLSTTLSTDNFKLPELGGSYTFLYGNYGSYIQGEAIGAARLTGVIVGAAGNTFAVDIMLDDRLDPGDTGYSEACRFRGQICVPTDGWHVYMALTGTLTGLSGAFKDAVYNVTLRDTGLTCDVGTGTTPAAQVGYGANIHNGELGVFAGIYFELADPAAYPDESRPPVGPFSGELSLEFLSDIPGVGYPVPSPHLTGTWEGVIDCAGMLNFTDVETFSSPMTLKVGPQSGLNYNVELSYLDDEAKNVVVATYCAEYTIDLHGGQINKGRMINSDSSQPPVLLKVGENYSGAVKLKAREFFNIQDGGDADAVSDGLDFCKWSFTQASTADPGIDITSACLFDEDGDGVSNYVDRCPGTPSGAVVGATGC